MEYYSVMTPELSRLWKEKFKITSLLVNPMGKLGLYGTLNLLQETAWMHADSLGFGMKDMEDKGIFWVLTRQILQMKSWPRFGESVTVETWLRPPEGAFVTREFNLKNRNGEIIGACSTSWLALDRDTKKIQPAESLRPWKDLALEQTTGLVPEKIPVKGEYLELAKFRVRNSDLDVNQHVNNTKYSQWILDAIPYDLHRNLTLNSYAVNFLAETHLGDKVRIEKSVESSDAAADKGVSIYRGVRANDEKILFTARLEWEKMSK